MSIRVSCPQCSTQFTAPAEMSGRRGRCQKCGERFTIPDLAAVKSVTVQASTPVDWKELEDRAAEDAAKRHEIHPLEREPLPELKAPETLALRSLAVVFAVLFVLELLIGLGAVASALLADSPAMLVPAVGLLVGSVFWLLLRELIGLGMAIERNTREAANRAGRV